MLNYPFKVGGEKRNVIIEPILWKDGKFRETKMLEKTPKF